MAPSRAGREIVARTSRRADGQTRNGGLMDRREFVGGAAAVGIAAQAAARGALDFVPPWTSGGSIPRGGGVIHWVALGEGPPLVMMPKLGGWVADWRQVAPVLAKRFRVIAIDPPGHGGSHMATPPPYIQTLPESAAMVRAALSTLGIERFSFVGNSLGGCIGTIMAALFPDDIEKLALVSVALATKGTASDMRDYDARTAKDVDASGMPIPRPFDNTSARFGTTSQINDELNASRAAAGLWVRPSERGVLTCGITNYLPRIKAKTFLLYGSGGSYQRYRDTALTLIPSVSTDSIPDTGAFVHQEKPAETAALLMKFLTA
jgi:pimeloyl-ACP methyl ester carboxylesterase